MRKDKRKLASFLLAIACVSCAVGGFVVGGKALKETNITAKAETTTCVMSQIGVLNSSTASVIQAYSILETEKPIVDSWSYKFTFEEGSGRGFLYNGETHTGWTIKQPGRDMYIELGKTAAVGDYVIIDGSFYNADSDTRLSFSCKFQWNGEKWVDYVEEEKPEEDSKYTTYTITKIGANRDSSANVAYVYSLGGDAFPKDQGEWQSVYTPSADASVKLNGEVISVGKIKLPGDLYIPLNVTAVAGDVLTINGGFYNDEKGIMLVFKNCQLKFDGEAWMTVDTEIEDPDPELPEEPDQPAFATYDLGTLTFRDWTADKNHMYLRGTKANGSITPRPVVMKARRASLVCLLLKVIISTLQNVQIPAAITKLNLTIIQVQPASILTISKVQTAVVLLVCGPIMVILTVVAVGCSVRLSLLPTPMALKTEKCTPSLQSAV